MQVDVGDFLRFTSCVLYTEVDNPDQPLINVEVVAHVTRPEIRSSEVKILYMLILYKKSYGLSATCLLNFCIYVMFF